MTKQSEKTENRLATLEANYNSLEEKLEEITENHLIHIASDIKDMQKSISAIDKKLAMWSGGITLGVYLLEKFIL